jgi:adenylate cyclase
MQLSSALSWLVDAAGDMPGADRLLAELGARLMADGVPLAGGALTLAVPHPLIARRTWLWRADSGEVIEALGFAGGLPLAETAAPNGDAGRRWLTELAGGVVHGMPLAQSRIHPCLAGSGRARSRLTRAMRCVRRRALPPRRSPPSLRARR